MAECMNFRSIVGSNKYRYHGMIWPAITSRHNQKWCVNMEECMNFRSIEDSNKYFMASRNRHD